MEYTLHVDAPYASHLEQAINIFRQFTETYPSLSLEIEGVVEGEVSLTGTDGFCEVWLKGSNGSSIMMPLIMDEERCYSNIIEVTRHGKRHIFCSVPGEERYIHSQINLARWWGLRNGSEDQLVAFLRESLPEDLM